MLQIGKSDTYAEWDERSKVARVYGRDPYGLEKFLRSDHARQLAEDTYKYPPGALLPPVPSQPGPIRNVLDFGRSVDEFADEHEWWPVLSVPAHEQAAIRAKFRKPRKRA